MQVNSLSLWQQHLQLRSRYDPSAVGFVQHPLLRVQPKLLFEPSLLLEGAAISNSLDQFHWTPAKVRDHALSMAGAQRQPHHAPRHLRHSRRLRTHRSLSTATTPSSVTVGSGSQASSFLTSMSLLYPLMSPPGSITLGSDFTMWMIRCIDSLEDQGCEISIAIRQSDGRCGCRSSSGAHGHPRDHVTGGSVLIIRPAWKLGP